MDKTISYFSLEKDGENTELLLKQKKLELPQNNEVQVQHTYIAINHTDQYIASFPCVIGTTAIGNICKIGKAVKDSTTNNNVVYLKSDFIDAKVIYLTDTLGAYSEARNIHQDLTYKIPFACDDKIIVAYYEKLFTAFYLMRYAFLVLSKDYVLVNNAASPLGQVMCKLGKYFKSNIIALVNNNEEKTMIDKIGIKHVIVDDENIADNIMQITGNIGVKVIYDLIGGEDITKLYSYIMPYGYLFHVHGNIPKIVLSNLYAKNIMVSKPNIYSLNKTQYKLIAENVVKLLANKSIATENIVEYDFKDIAIAYEELEQKHKYDFVIAKVLS